MIDYDVATTTSTKNMARGAGPLLQVPVCQCTGRGAWAAGACGAQDPGPLKGVEVIIMPVPVVIMECQCWHLTDST